MPAKFRSAPSCGAKEKVSDNELRKHKCVQQFQKILVHVLFTI